MDTTQAQPVTQRWHVIQDERLPGLAEPLAPLTPKREKVIHTLERVSFKEFTGTS